MLGHIMSDYLYIAAFMPGLIAGTLVVKLVIHWVALLMTGLGRDPGSTSLPQKRMSIWPLIFAVIHPVPWLLLLGMPYGIYHLAENPPAPGWFWFLGGALFAIVATPLAVYIMLHKFRTRAATETDSTIGGNDVA
jgi:hypothetical protein